MSARRVLVVDDDPHILEVLGMRLESMGLDVTAVGDPAAAVPLLAAAPFDLALFDLRMDPIDGLALMREAHGRQPGLPVLIMTAHATIDGAVHAVKEGAFDYLTKPFVTDELRRKVAHALRQRRWARDRSLLRRLGESLASANRPETVLEVVVQATREATETSRACVFLDAGGTPSLHASAGAAPVADADLYAAAEAVQAGREPAPEAAHAGVVAVPLVVDGKRRGALVVVRPAGVAMTGDDHDVLGVFAAQAAVAMKSADELARARSGALTALGRVATQVAHEINNPLGGIKLFLALLGKRLGAAADEPGLDLVRKAERAIDRLARLVVDITAFGRSAAVQREPTLPSELVHDCLALAHDRVTERQVNVVLALDDGAERFPLDPRDVQRALLNLVLNALDAMQPGGTLTLRSARCADGALMLLVEDTGHGFEPETQARAFDLFFTTKSEGTGLGMSIVRSVAERHGGRVEIDSAPGRGTRVTLVLAPG
ncbi:MAG: response regulator [bacterium]|nr:response regulator [bacterium]